MKIALVDMDGTLCDYEGAMQRELQKLCGDEADIMDPQYKKIVDLIKQQPGFWRNLLVIPSGLKMVSLLKKMGFDIHILTKGPYRTISAWSEKVEWVREHLPDTPITITENKGLVYGRVLFDDWPPYCEAWLKHRPRGLVIMPAYRYNKGLDEKYPGKIIRFTGDNLEEVEIAVAKVAKLDYKEEA